MPPTDSLLLWLDANDVQGVIAKYPEYQTLVAQLISLYSEITKKALENEENP